MSAQLALIQPPAPRLQPQVTLDEFQDRTCLMPYMVADAVMRRRGLPQDGDAFATHVAEKTVRVYNHNEQFRKRMNSSDPRRLYDEFVNHWLDAWLKRH